MNHNFIKKILIFLLVILVSFSCSKSKESSSSVSVNEVKDFKVEIKELDAAWDEVSGYISANIFFSGRIEGAKDFSSFPDLSRILIEEEKKKAQQLLMVSNGSGVGLLVTTKTSFSTTGHFNLNVYKRGDIATNMGSIPVYVEYDLYQGFYDQGIQLSKIIENKGMAFFKEKMKSYVSEAKRLKSLLKDNAMTEGMISGYLMASTNSDLKSSYIAQSKAYSVVSCHIAVSGVSKKDWEDFLSVQSPPEKEFKYKEESVAKRHAEIVKKYYCLDLTSSDNTSLMYATFEQCMCGKGSGLVAEKSRKGLKDDLEDYSKFLVKEFGEETRKTASVNDGKVISHQKLEESGKSYSDRIELYDSSIGGYPSDKKTKKVKKLKSLYE